MLEFAGVMVDLIKLMKERTRPGKLLLVKRLYTDHMKRMWKSVMIIIYFTKMMHKDTTLHPDMKDKSQIQIPIVFDKLDELRERDGTTITEGIHKEWGMNNQLLSYDVPLVKNLDYCSGDVHAVAAAAIALGHRENYKSYMYQGGARDPKDDESTADENRKDSCRTGSFKGF